MSRKNIYKNKIIFYQKRKQIFDRIKTQSNKRLVLVGGCFDILHLGHVKFLQKAKEQGDLLLILLESDQHITELKGKNRPINIQIDRAEVLAGLQAVDFILLLPYLSTNQEYEEVILPIKPAIIATTKGDPNRFYKERIGKLISALVIDVIDYIPGKSTTSHLATSAQSK